MRSLSSTALFLSRKKLAFRYRGNKNYILNFEKPRTILFADMTLFAVLAMAVLATLSIFGMVYLSRKSSRKAKAYTVLSDTPEE